MMELTGSSSGDTPCGIDSCAGFVRTVAEFQVGPDNRRFLRSAITHSWHRVRRSALEFMKDLPDRNVASRIVMAACRGESSC